MLFGGLRKVRSEGSERFFKSIISKKKSRNIIKETNEQLKGRIEEESVYEGHSWSVLSTLYFPPPIGMIVSSSWDGSIRLWSVASGKCLKVIKEHSDSCRHLIRWKSSSLSISSFLSCSDDSKICSFTISPFKLQRTFLTSGSPVVRLLQLSEDEFLGVNTNDELFIIPYVNSLQKVRNLKSEKIGYNTNLIKSKSIETCFLINTYDEKKTVKLIDYEKNETLLEFTEHQEESIYTISTFKNTKGEEMLICGGKEKNLHVYSLSSPLLQRNDRMIRSVRFDFPICSSLCLHNSYLCLGGTEGSFCVVSLSDRKQNQYEKVVEKKIHGGWIKVIDEMITTKNGMFTKFVSCSFDLRIKVHCLCFLNEEEDVKDFDLCFGSVIKEFVGSNSGDRVQIPLSISKSEIQDLNRSLIMKTISRFFEFSVKKERRLEYSDFSYFIEHIIEHRSLIHLKNSSLIYLGSLSRTENNPQPNGFGVLFEKVKGGSLLKRRSDYCPQYIGQFKNGMKDGTGILLHPKTRRVLYEGEFGKGKKEGKGKDYETFRGQQEQQFILFQGRFSDGMRHGKGEMYDTKDNVFVKGRWNRGTLEERYYEYDCPLICYFEIEKYLTDTAIIGRGGYGILYRIKSSLIPTIKTSDEYLVVKVMVIAGGSQVYARTVILNMIRREVELISRIKEKKHILGIHAMIEGKQVGMILPYLKMSVDRVIQSSNGSLSIEEKIRFLYQVAKGMKSLHQQNTMHRDLKWGNILLTFDDVIKITDFDTLREDERHWKCTNLTLTSRVGTSGFVAPEIYRGERYGPSVDVFSFGLMIFALLFERNMPYSTQYQCVGCGVNLENILRNEHLNYHVSKCKLRPLLDPKRVSTFPKFLIDLCVHCWRDDPHGRPRFEEIVDIFENERKKKICYSIVHLIFEKHPQIRDQSMLLVQPKISGIKEWVERKYVGSKVMSLTCSVGTVTTSKKSERMRMEDDEDVFRVVQHVQETKEEWTVFVELNDELKGEEEVNENRFDGRREPKILDFEEESSVPALLKRIRNLEEIVKLLEERNLSSSEQLERANKKNELLEEENLFLRSQIRSGEHSNILQEKATPEEVNDDDE